MTVTIVISRYNESIQWVKELSYPFVIYNKGKEDIDFDFIKLPNVGRESSTYIYHIIENYNNLPDFLILLQANPFEHCQKLFNSIEKFDTENITILCDGKEWNDLKLVPKIHQDGISHIVNKLHLQEYLKNYDAPVYKYGIGSQWILPKKFIINKSLSFWQSLYDVHFMHEHTPWVLERMFFYIFTEYSNL